MKSVKISNNVIRRLPRYLRKLDELTEDGVSRISSFELANLLGLTASQQCQLPDHPARADRRACDPRAAA